MAGHLVSSLARNTRANSVTENYTGSELSKFGSRRLDDLPSFGNSGRDSRQMALLSQWFLWFFGGCFESHGLKIKFSRVIKLLIQTCINK